jgi:hypothetical protein
MKRPLLLLALLPMILFLSCSNDPKETTNQEGTEDLTTLTAEEGLMALKVNCYSCHNPLTPSHDELLAPPMVAVKFRYKKLYPEREAFITQMTDFIHEPTEEKAKMKNPVNRFGVMPKTLLNKEEIMDISAYIYDHQLEEPKWFAEHFEEEHGRKWVQE